MVCSSYEFAPTGHQALGINPGGFRMTVSLPFPRSWRRYLAIWWPDQWYRPRITWARVHLCPEDDA